MFSFFQRGFFQPPTICAQGSPAPSRQLQTLRHGLDQSRVPPVFQLEKMNDHDVYEITVAELQHAFAKGAYSSVDYVNLCLQRIQKIDCYLEAVIEVNPDALDIAKALDQERASGKVRGPLHGVPVLVKDNIATKDKMQTTAGSWSLLGGVVPRDASVVAQLRDAGAIVLGKANMTEFAALRSKVYSSAYSARRGEVRNPFDLSRSPYGSSAGSAVAVSANIVPLSVGTETDSSIIGPAAINGVVGIKPTVGLTSRSGVIPISEHMDTVGLMARRVSDAVTGLNAMVAPDTRDTATLHPSRVQENDFTKFMSTKEALKGARFGLPWKRCWELVDTDQKAVAQKVLDAIECAGGTICRTDFPSAEERIPPDGQWDWEFGAPEQSEFTVIAVDAYNGIRDYLSECSGIDVRSVEDIIEFNIRNRGSEGAEPGDHPAFPSGQDNLVEIAKGKGVKTETYHNALKYIRQKSREEGIDGALKHPDGDFDALLMCDRSGIGQQLAAQAGYPIISIPIGLDSSGIPVALSLHQSAWKEGVLVKWASAIEDLLDSVAGWRPTPEYRNHLSKNIPVYE